MHFQQEIKEAKEVLRIANDIQQGVNQILQPPMAEQDIARIVAACGYACDFRDELTGRGDGKSKRYVIARTRGKQNVKRSLGRVEKVLALSQDDLLKLIEAKFKEK